MDEAEFVALAAITGDAIDIAWDETNKEWSGIIVFKNNRFITSTNKSKNVVVKELQRFWHDYHDRSGI